MGAARDRMPMCLLPGVGDAHLPPDAWGPMWLPPAQAADGRLRPPRRHRPGGGAEDVTLDAATDTVRLAGRVVTHRSGQRVDGS